MTQDDIHEEDERLIAERAYALYQARGREHGHDVEDWLAAKEQVRSDHREKAQAAESPAPVSAAPSEPMDVEVQEKKGLG